MFLTSRHLPSALDLRASYSKSSISNVSVLISKSDVILLPIRSPPNPTCCPLGSEIRGASNCQVRKLQMPLNQLPEELLAEVLRNIDNVEDRLQVSLTSQRLHEAVEPILYSSFRQTGREATGAFIRTILEKPHVARFVKSFTAHSINSPYALATELRAVSTVLPRAGFKQRIGQMMRDIPGITVSADKWLSDFYFSYWDACTAFLVLLLPNIEQLQLRVFESVLLNCGDELLLHYLPLAFRAASLETETFLAWQKTLRSITIENWEEYGTLIGSLAAFSGFESIRSFTILGSEDFAEEYYDDGDTPLISDLTNLSLLSSNIGSDTLKDFLSHCSQLKRLEYFHKEVSGRYGPPDAHDNNFSPAAFGRGIEHLHECLEELVVVASDYWLNMMPFDAPRLLSEFEALRLLDTTECILLGRDKTDPSYFGWTRLHQHYTMEEFRESILNLPASLEHLTVRNCRVDIFDWLDFLLEGLESSELHLKKLQEITFIFHETSPLIPNDSRSRRIDWHERALRLGIKLMNHAQGEVRWGPPGDIYNQDDVQMP
ncbi:hypothetical protein DL98DRAFT_658842 [Cadophora sp. DSE1049]|nr:hypothetical protein DL98DRAFT_658842 [Cadophora sp. DSE1049]